MKPEFIPEIYGHRGCRGLMPENSIPAFLHAIELGCRAIELDVVISKDKQVVVSHEAFISKFICLDANNRPIPDEQDKELNIYKMDYESLKYYDCGSVFHSGFINQQKMQVHKPTLQEVIDSVTNFCKYRNIDSILYNIEIKSRKEDENIYQPEVNEFADLVLEVIKQNNISSNCIIQSFDERILQYFHKKSPQIKLTYLFKTETTFKECLEILKFKPNYISPNYTLITESFVLECEENNIGLLAWTVNELKDLEKMIAFKVDGIITDYPNRAFELLNK